MSADDLERRDGRRRGRNKDTMKLHAHLHGDSGVRSISLHNEVGIDEVFDIVDIIPSPSEFREWFWFPSELHL